MFEELPERGRQLRYVLYHCLDFRSSVTWLSRKICPHQQLFTWEWTGKSGCDRWLCWSETWFRLDLQVIFFFCLCWCVRIRAFPCSLLVITTVLYGQNSLSLGFIDLRKEEPERIQKNFTSRDVCCGFMSCLMQKSVQRSRWSSQLSLGATLPPACKLLWTKVRSWSHWNSWVRILWLPKDT